jgi:hypothetical protein
MYNEMTPMEQGEYLNQTLTDDQCNFIEIDGFPNRSSTSIEGRIRVLRSSTVN